MLIKIVHEGVVQRVQVDSPATFKLEHVLQLARKFPGIPPVFAIQYLDDENEKVNIESTEELLEALRVAEQEARPCLRLQIVASTQTHSHFSEDRDEDVDEDNRSAGEEDSASAGSNFELVDESEFREHVEPDELPAVHSTPPPVQVSELAETLASAPSDEAGIADAQREEPAVSAAEPPELPDVGVVSVSLSSLSIGDEEPPRPEVPDPAAEIPVSGSAHSETATAAANLDEVARTVISDVAATEFASLLATLDQLIKSHNEGTGGSNSQATMDSLRASCGKVLSDPNVVQELQAAISSPVVRSLVVDSFASDQQGKTMWEAASAHVPQVLQVVSHLLEKCPQLVALVPGTVMAAMNFFRPRPDADADAAPASAAPLDEFKDVVHRHVQCNGCLEANPRLSEYIRGPRFKSAIVEDFDLCERCERSNRYRDSHGPFLKIYYPAQAPQAILCVLRGNGRTSQSDFARFFEQERAAGNIQGNQYRDVQVAATGFNPSNIRELVESHVGGAVAASASSVAAASSSVSVTPAAVQESVRQAVAASLHSATAAGSVSQPAAVPSSSAPRTLGCPGANHPLVQFIAERPRYRCDKCNRRCAQSETLHGCRTCNFDMCDQCFKALLDAHSGSRTAAVSAPIFYPSVGEAAAPVSLAPAQPRLDSAARGQSAPHPDPHSHGVPQVRPQAKFVLDVSIPDGSVVAPGQKFLKSWRIRNNGSSVWPPGCRIVNVGGDPLGSPIGGVFVDPLEPGHVADLSVPLVAPVRPGRAVGYFRLITPDNNRFGHRFWVDITVDGTIGQQIAAAVAQPFRTISEQIIAAVQEQEMASHSGAVGTGTGTGTGAGATGAPDATMAQAAVASASGPVGESNPQGIDNTANDQLLKKYSIELQSLADMGFLDVKENIRVLEMNNGSLENAIAHLLATAFA